jgi:hypothetical protein
MGKEYTVKRIEHENGIKQNVWEDIPNLAVDEYPWDENGYKPVTGVKLFYTPSHLHIRFISYEDRPRATYRKMNDPVFRDSCVEFFFNPLPELDERYFNFEMNAAGVLLLGLGEDRQTRTRLFSVDPAIFRIMPSKDISKSGDLNYWTLEYSIPFSFIWEYGMEFRAVSGATIAANFYKCGDDTEFPHYGSWNPIRSSKPDFHKPECFGTLKLE